MGFGQRVLQAVRVLADPEYRKKTLGQFVADFLASYEIGLTHHREWKVKEAVQFAYRGNPTAYACQDIIASTMASVPWQVESRKTGDPMDSGPAFDFLAHPNSRDSWGKQIAKTSVWLSNGGTSYWHLKQLPEQGEIRTLYSWVLRADRTDVKPQDDGTLLYVYTVGGEEKKYPEDEIVEFQMFDPLNDLFGMGPTQPARQSIDGSNAMEQWNKDAIEDNRYTPNLVVINKSGVPSQRQHDRERDQYDERGGALKGNARRTLLISGDADAKEMFTSPVEMDFNESMSRYDRRICMAYHVHPCLLGVADATYENLKTAIQALMLYAVIPGLTNIRDALNIQLAPKFGDDVYFDFDLSKTLFATWQRRENAEEAKTYVSGMYLSPRAVNERLGLGFDPEECLDVGMAPATYLPVGGELGERSTRSINLQGDDAKAAQWRATDRRKEAWARGVAPKIAGLFKAEGSKVAEAIERGGEPSMVVDSMSSQWRAVLEASYRAVIEDAGEEIATQLSSRTITRIERRFDFDPWSDAIRDHVLRVVAEQVGHIQDTTKERIRASLLAGLADNETTDQLVKRIQEMYATWEGREDLTRSRAFTIARTEVHGATGFAHQESARQSGVVEMKEWLAVGDDRTRDPHVAMSGERRRLGEPYSNGLMFPGDPSGDPSETANCRCSELYHTR